MSVPFNAEEGLITKSAKANGLAFLPFNRSQIFFIIT